MAMQKKSATRNRKGPPKKKAVPQRSAARMSAPKKLAAAQKSARKKSPAKRRAAGKSTATKKQAIRPSTGSIGVTITSPTSGQKITLPFTAKGTASASGGDTIKSMWRQVDETSPHVKNGGLVAISPPYANWTSQITSTDCPDVPGSYNITAFASDGTITYDSNTVNFTV